jgi:hypothetical protein
LSQDKLGTNTGNVEKETFLQGESKAEKRIEGQNMSLFCVFFVVEFPAV